MRFHYAVSTMIFWWRETNLSFEMECEFLKSQGFGVELWPYIRGQNECRFEKKNWPRLLATTRDMLVSMRSRNDHPTLQQWDEQFECARLLNSDIVADLKSLGMQDKQGENGSDFIEQVVSLAEEKNVMLCIETGNLSTLKHLADRFDSIHFCLDTGYANLDPVFSFKQYIDDLAERITHLHLSDNYGRQEDHQPPGLKGGISREHWDYLLEALSRYDKDVIASFEISPSMPTVLLRQASEFVFDELKWPDRPQKQPGAEAVTYHPY
ncbi:MAG: sugar phosphate isomerase/epimerase family protein [Planctomycetota bacterium]|jgi:sugar phosphate isomerase/epimerase